MAILEMGRLTLIAHADSKKNLLNALQHLGAVEIISTSMDGLALSASPDSLVLLEDKLSSVREALETIRPYDENKPSMLTPKPPITRAALSDMPGKFAEADDLISKIKLFADNTNAAKTQQQQLKNRIAALMPYASFDAPLESVGTGQYTYNLLGTIPSENIEKYNKIREDYSDSAYFENLESSRDIVPVYIVMLKSVQEQLVGELKFLGLAEAFTKDLFGTPASIIESCKNENETLDLKLQEYNEAAKKLSSEKAVLKELEDYLLNEISREKCVERLGETGSAFVLEGWVIADEQPIVEKSVLHVAPEAYIAFRAPAEDEISPTVLNNSRLVQPFESITNMYSVPSSKGFDPNKLMSVFYFLIFGMMVGDFAYGVILTIGAFVMLKLKKPTGMFQRITKVIMYCGVSTALWGLFFGTIFSIEGIPAVLNPLQNAESALMTLGLCLGIGVVHIFVGLGIGIYMDIKRGHILAALFDRFSWILLVAGGIMMLVGSPVGAVGTYLALAGALTLLLTQGRHKKGIVKKLMGGLSSLYGVTSYISDILSYCRIFGMALATTVIAMVFNTIAGLLMGNFVGYIFGIVILTVGHVFNIAINALGAFVHTARLQYIEFFNKFYEGDGHAFSPLGVRTKNHRLEG